MEFCTIEDRRSRVSEFGLSLGALESIARVHREARTAGRGRVMSTPVEACEAVLRIHSGRGAVRPWGTIEYINTGVDGASSAPSTTVSPGDPLIDSVAALKPMYRAGDSRGRRLRALADRRHGRGNAQDQRTLANRS
jgi:hypothetical protein